MSNIIPLCPCPDSQDPRIKCFKKSSKENKKNCNMKLFEYYKNIIQHIKDIFQNSINAIDTIESKKINNLSQDYVVEALPLFIEFKKAIDNYIDYKNQIKNDNQYIEMQKCFYNNCDNEIRKQMKNYIKFIQNFKKFLSDRKNVKPKNILEKKHNELVNSVIETIIALYSDEITDYETRFIKVSPKHKQNLDSFLDKNEEDEESVKKKKKPGDYDQDEEEEVEESVTKKKPGDYDQDEDEEEVEESVTKKKLGDYDIEDPIDKEKLDCQSDTNCILLNNCLSPPNQSKSCICINEKSTDKESKKKACNILGECKYKNDSCSKRESTVAFSYNNFCENISRLDGNIKTQTSCLKDKKIKKQISLLLNSKNIDKDCSKIKDKEIKDCLEILEEGKKCCVEYYEKKKKFFLKK